MTSHLQVHLIIHTPVPHQQLLMIPTGRKLSGEAEDLSICLTKGEGGDTRQPAALERSITEIMEPNLFPVLADATLRQQLQIAAWEVFVEHKENFSH